MGFDDTYCSEVPNANAMGGRPEFSYGDPKTLHPIGTEVITPQARI